MTTEPEVRPDWTGPRITDWVKAKRAPKRPDLMLLRPDTEHKWVSDPTSSWLPQCSACGASLDAPSDNCPGMRRPVDLIAERPDAPFCESPATEQYRPPQDDLDRPVLTMLWALGIILAAINALAAIDALVWTVLR